jgi:ferrous iron transport protein A
MLTFMGIINLLQVQTGTSVQIRSFSGGKSLVAKLRQYGLFVGDQARLLRLAPFSGPVLLEINGREIALGRDIAAQIMVEII